ncbi:MAG: hypothetical protein B7Y15_05085 [Bacteroidetes bacterium 24-39-8]|nr:MAG: hypothetical protein B7Y15_05085 [Bacteroidetes bacterium 24-39-8]OZA68171.1 MAG: hypothetical protein B7X72_02280 [Sphingobacteriia bacterium 39-39-8]
MKPFKAILVLFLIPILLPAQDELAMPLIPAMRQLHHEYIIGSIQKINQLPAVRDSGYQKTMVWVDETITGIRAQIERNQQLEDNAKYRWLRSVNEVLTGFLQYQQSGQIRLNQLEPLIKAYQQAMKLALADQSIYPVFENNDLVIGNILIDNFCLKTNQGIPAAKDLLVWKYCQIYPDQILNTLSKQPQNIFADTLIVQAAFQDPEKLYNFAAAPNALGRKIQSVNHVLVKIIGQLSLTKTGRMYFPFLDQLYHGKFSMEDITPMLVDDSASRYYKLLVDTRIEYAGRMQKGDTPLLEKVLTAKLRSKAVELYINEINALHELKDLKIRFKVLDKLTAAELYYLAVMGESELYTSSFVSGVYPRIFQKMLEPNADTLLSMVNNDFFKKFIRVSAAYNTLDDFLRRMDSASAKKRMESFVDGLELSASLEDAVDVADSYSSIYQPQLRQLILDRVQMNRLKNWNAQNKKGVRIYKMLDLLFQSLDSSCQVDLSKELGIDPVYEMANRLLQDSAGRIVIQQFFYGDKDGMNVFLAFLAGFNNGKWWVIQKPEWVEIVAKTGVPITIYANKPLNEQLDLDAKAQASLSNYLADKGLEPSIVIHRGHSYHLRSTIEQLAPSAKLVILGGCGGYQNLNDVLQICPTAQIISTKQVGTGVINKGLINEISETLRAGQNLNWPSLWNNMAKQLGPKYKETFDDYVPPHKNLGAIFITAFNHPEKVSK